MRQHTFGAINIYNKHAKLLLGRVAKDLRRRGYVVTHKVQKNYYKVFGSGVHDRYLEIEDYSHCLGMDGDTVCRWLEIIADGFQPHRPELNDGGRATRRYKGRAHIQWYDLMPDVDGIEEKPKEPSLWYSDEAVHGVVGQITKEIGASRRLATMAAEELAEEQARQSAMQAFRLQAENAPADGHVMIPTANAKAIIQAIKDLETQIENADYDGG